MNIIDKVVAIQRTENSSDEVFARKLGMHRITWFNKRTGKSPLTLKDIQKIIALYPGLRKEGEKILLADATKHSNITKDSSNE